MVCPYSPQENNAVPYPSAPWTLRGHALQTLHLVDSASVRSLLPSGLEVLEPWPGKAVASVYLSAYQAGSVLEYNELIVATLIRQAGNIGGWVTHIYVDHPDSVAGGREIWGLPKELAEFTWEAGETKQVTVRQGDRLLCSLRYEPPFSLWRQPFSATSFSLLDSALLSFAAHLDTRLGVVKGHLEVPANSPLAQIYFGQPWLTVSHAEMELRVDAPRKRVANFTK
ncbi:acetoacetate decarboxylase family protein [Trichocoleus sp. FACHB-591]|uniref:acetoacetate decarboxylase family protein n=1 Tax=Trichocoleus sp. FACHB-591 TaxID=2692872 RepID=UPI0018EF7568|nr:acetoacetate decarboxylase family protein [Trichocoleus sp. FACHB-591]